MRVKFLRTVPSGSPDFPFQAGQIIVLPKLTAEVRQWLADEAAVLLADEPETAMFREALNDAMLPRGKARGRGDS